MTPRHYRKHRTAYNSNRKPERFNIERYDPVHDEFKIIAWGKSEQYVCDRAHRGCHGNARTALVMTMWEGSKR